MKSRDELQCMIDALRERVSRMSAASLRINSSLDLNTVLHEVVETASALTGARFGGITTIDKAGLVEDFVSTGITPEEHSQLLGWSEGARLFEHIRDLPAPLRVTDARAYVRKLGLSDHLIPWTTMQGTPMRHRDEHIGNFYLCDKEGGQTFTDEDEEILVLFASQAATAISNARTYRKEQRARADLEALFDTSPVGVAVLDANTGAPVSFNREANRLVQELQTPGETFEQLLGVMTYRRGGGPEIPLRESPFATQPFQPDTVRAEEFLLAVPDGRSVTTLVNATPIHSADGTLESMVVTLQDLAPLKEIERLRVQFVGLVSQELRAPLTSIKGSAAALLDSTAALDPAEQREYARIIDGQADRMRGLISELLDAGRIETGTLSVRPESWEVAALVDRARYAFLRGGSPHTVLIDLPPDLPRVMAERRRIVQVLNNLFSNAARHAVASSPIRVSAMRDGTHVAISVADEGRGVAPERLPRLFHKHTGAGDGERGGGLGLAICKGLVEAHGGRIWAESAGPRQGVRYTFTLPVAEEASGSPSPVDSAGKTRKHEPILVAGDDPPTLRYVRDALTEAGYRPIVTGDHRELGRLIRTEAPRLVLLDMMRPAAGGIELMRIVPELSDVPVIFISDHEREKNISKALQSGAADYIAKPFSATELTARIGAALRKRAEPEPFALGDLAIHFDRRHVSVGGQPVELTVTEYELLRVLSVSAGRVMTFDSLLRQVWRGRGHASPNLVRAFIKTLRSKLGDDAGDPTYIFSQRGVGYRMGRPQ